MGPDCSVERLVLVRLIVWEQDKGTGWYRLSVDVLAHIEEPEEGHPSRYREVSVDNILWHILPSQEISGLRSCAVTGSRVKCIKRYILRHPTGGFRTLKLLECSLAPCVTCFLGVAEERRERNEEYSLSSHLGVIV